jgi:putative phage-type endonuclease
MREEWLGERAYRLGASETASAIGVNQYESQLRLWLTKTGKLPAKEANEAMEIGSAMEPVILDLYSRRTGNKIARTQVFHVSDEHDFLCATLDGITEGGINVQAKNVGCQAISQWGPEVTDEVPHQVLVQVQQEMYVSGLTMTHIPALMGGSELRIYKIKRDDKLIDRIVTMAGAFMQQVEDRKYPQPDKGRDSGLLHYLFPECEGEMLFDDEQTAIVHQWEEAGEQLKLLEKTKDGLKMDILMAMKEASLAILTDGRALARSITHVPASVREVKSYSFPVLRVKKALR